MTGDGPDPDVTIERPSTGAADTVTDLWVDLAEGQRRYGSHLLTEPNRGRIREAAVRGIVTDSLLVARDGDAVVGFVSFAVESGVYDQDVRRGLVENLYVVPERRDERVGEALLHAAEERLHERGCAVVYLETLAGNADARRFYRRQGYAPHRIQFERRIDDERETPGDTGTDATGENHTTPDAENDTHTRDD